MEEFIPLVGSMTDRGIDANVSAIPTKDQTFQNCLFYPVENPYTGKKTIFVEKRMGVPSSGTQDTDYVALTGFYYWRALGKTCRYGYYSPAGNVYRMTPVDSGGTKTAQNTSLSPIFHVSEAKNASGTTAIFYISAGSSNTYSTVYMFADGDVSDTHITVPSGSIGHLVHIDGYVIVANTDGRLYNSPLNTPTGTYTDFIGVDITPGPLVTAFKYRNYVLAFKAEAMEVFRIGEQTTGSPLQRLSENFQKVGIFKPTSGGGLWASLSGNAPPIVEGNNNIFWIGQTEDGLGVYTMNGLVPEKISGAFQDKYLINFDGYIKFIQMGGRKLLLIYCANEWLCYDVEGKIWNVWVSAKSSSLFRSWENTVNGQGIISASGNSYYIYEPGNPVPYLDIDTSIVRLIRTSVIDADSRDYKDFTSFSLIGDLQGSTSNITVSWSKDDYVTWSTGKDIDMSLTNSRLYALGVARRIAFRLSDTLQSPARLQGIELNYNKRSS